MYKKILLPTDGSLNAEKAGKHALWLANTSNAEIVVLYVYELYSPRIGVLPLSIVPGSNETLYEPLKEEGKKYAYEFKEKLEALEAEEDYKNIKITAVVEEGRPYNAILNMIESENFDLVVMGASGKHGLDRYTLGSVTERVVRETKKPVLVIP
jgi:nucleotide-binding universal stress UspA family protein